MKNRSGLDACVALGKTHERLREETKASGPAPLTPAVLDGLSVKAWRVRIGLSRPVLGSMLGLGCYTIKDIERGRLKPKQVLLDAMSDPGFEAAAVLRMQKPAFTLEDLLSRAIPEPNSGCWIWCNSVNTSGYGHIWIDGKSVGAHRAAWMLRHGAIPDEMSVLHKCDNPPCINPDHLFLGTMSDNMKDMLSKGRKTKLQGTKNPKTKLSPTDVREIFLSPAGVMELARRYQIAPATIGSIRSGKNWAWYTSSLEERSASNA